MAAKKKQRGHLVIIGGAEDREDDKLILNTVCQLGGGSKADVVVLDTASRQAANDPEASRDLFAMYEQAFGACGAARVTGLAVHDRTAANDPEIVARVAEASVVFMAGGAQERLVSILGGTDLLHAMREGYTERGVCIAGTSAGASAISEHMLAGGPSDVLPRKGRMPIAPGLGFVRSIAIDQHFSERQRLGRLLAVVAQNPFLIGVGIDEDTALVIGADAGIEVVGRGSVTLLDARDVMHTSFNEVGDGEVVAINDVRLHLLPAGYRVDAEGAAAPPHTRAASPALLALMALVTDTCRV